MEQSRYGVKMWNGTDYGNNELLLNFTSFDININISLNINLSTTLLLMFYY